MTIVQPNIIGLLIVVQYRNVRSNILMKYSVLLMSSDLLGFILEEEDKIYLNLKKNEKLIFIYVLM